MASYMVEYRLPGGRRWARLFPTRQDVYPRRQKFHRDVHPNPATARVIRFLAMRRTVLDYMANIIAMRPDSYTGPLIHVCAFRKIQPHCSGTCKVDYFDCGVRVDGH